MIKAFAFDWLVGVFFFRYWAWEVHSSYLLIWRCIFSYILYIFLCIFVSFPTKLVSYIIIILKNQNNKLKFWVQSDFHHNNTYKSVRWCIVKHKLIPYIFENRKLNSLQRGLKYNIRLHHSIKNTLPEPNSLKMTQPHAVNNAYFSFHTKKPM